MVKRVLAFLKQYPTIAISLLIVLVLIGISIYAIVSIPLTDAIELWNEREYGAWKYTPRAVPPQWTNLFRRETLPPTISVAMFNTGFLTVPNTEKSWRSRNDVTFDYQHLGFPTEVKLYYNISTGAKRPLLTLTWIRPDGVEIELLRQPARGGESLLRIDPEEAFAGVQKSDADPNDVQALRGTYTLRADVLLFEEEGFAMNADLVVYGGVFGVTGTDSHRRDLRIGLLWGTPIALLFGFVAAAGTTIFGFVVAAIGAWMGGWIDATIQKITEVSMMIPFLPTVLMVGRFYSSSLWVIIAVVIAFGLFSGPLKTYRAMFLQVKQSQYIEAARAYGASNARIIFRYLIPRMIPTLLPRLMVGIPLYIYLEASLAMLGLSDPLLPTWGKILSEARYAVYMGHYHWALEPAFMLLLTGFSFSMLGYALDRVFNPRLRVN